MHNFFYFVVLFFLKIIIFVISAWQKIRFTSVFTSLDSHRPHGRRNFFDKCCPKVSQSFGRIEILLYICKQNREMPRVLREPLISNKTSTT